MTKFIVFLFSFKLLLIADKMKTRSKSVDAISRIGRRKNNRKKAFGKKRPLRKINKNKTNRA